ncbi:hypothetical protein HN748_03450 [Candidatus Peregrinibacteria bacterium]|jgi:flagellar basal body-associated protein FliL|nr:hypothetical protein [Candidatus Peregrinibacteria bacterium]MBT7483442.1 hypothetical protein [Candidatus Peregrinibacteria bacterium]MBT7703264.1 hypothetical protein [Candidatus Peregrinibacteria bacterium]
MDLQAFINRIKKTVLLTEEGKARFESEADEYSPELRQELISALEKHEKKFIQEGKEYLAQTKRDQINKQMTEIKITHSQEEDDEKTAAEKQLKTNLSKI